jgi:hypothetical protein
MFTKLTTAVVIAGAAMLASASPGAAQGTGSGPVATVCAAEISKYCATQRHGGGAVRACLEARRSKLSARCRNALSGTGGGYGRGLGRGW